MTSYHDFSRPEAVAALVARLDAAADRIDEVRDRITIALSKIVEGVDFMAVRAAAAFEGWSA